MLNYIESEFTVNHPFELRLANQNFGYSLVYNSKSMSIAVNCVISLLLIADTLKGGEEGLIIPEAEQNKEIYDEEDCTLKHCRVWKLVEDYRSDNCEVDEGTDDMDYEISKVKRSKPKCNLAKKKKSNKMAMKTIIVGKTKHFEPNDCINVVVRTTEPSPSFQLIFLAPKPQPALIVMINVRKSQPTNNGND